MAMLPDAGLTSREQSELATEATPDPLAAAEAHPLDMALPSDTADAPSLEPPGLLEETAELDMNSVLDDGSAEATHAEDPAQDSEQAWAEAGEPLAAEQEHLGLEPDAPGHEH